MHGRKYDNAEVDFVLNGEKLSVHITGKNPSRNVAEAFRNAVSIRNKAFIREMKQGVFADMEQVAIRYPFLKKI
jgi:hypothetical protein